MPNSSDDDCDAQHADPPPRRLGWRVALAVLMAGATVWVLRLAGGDEPARNGNPPLPDSVLAILDTASEVELRATESFSIDGLERIPFGTGFVHCHPARFLTAGEWFAARRLLVEGLEAREGSDAELIAALGPGHLIRARTDTCSVTLQLERSVWRMNYEVSGSALSGTEATGFRNTSPRALGLLNTLAPR